MPQPLQNEDEDNEIIIENDEPEDDSSPEDRAKAMGWRPKDEYKGPADKWVEADEFLKRAEEDPREVRKANHILMRKVQKLEQGIQSILSHQDRQLDQARAQAYKNAQNDLKRAHDEAVASGDVERADKVWTARETLALQQVEEAKTPQPRNNQEDTDIVAAWTAQNASWYGKNYKATKEAEQYEDWLAKQGVPLAQRLKQTAEYIQNEFLGEPEPKRRDGAPAPVGGNNNGSIRGNRKAKPGTYEALTAAARAECDRTVRQSGGKITKETWVSFASQDMFQ